MRDQTQTPSLPPMLQQAQEEDHGTYEVEIPDAGTRYELDLPLPTHKVEVRLKKPWTLSSGLLLPEGTIAYDEIVRVYRAVYAGGVWSFEVDCENMGAVRITASVGETQWIETSRA